MCPQQPAPSPPHSRSSSIPTTPPPVITQLSYLSPRPSSPSSPLIFRLWSYLPCAVTTVMGVSQAAGTVPSPQAPPSSFIPYDDADVVDGSARCIYPSAILMGFNPDASTSYLYVSQWPAIPSMCPVSCVNAIYFKFLFFLVAIRLHKALIAPEQRR